MTATGQAFALAYQNVLREIADKSLQTDFFAVRRVMYARLTGLPSEMRNNAIKAATSAWKSWIAMGRRGHPPRSRRNTVLFTHGRDWSLPAPGIVSIRTLAHRVRVRYIMSPGDACRLAVAASDGRVGAAALTRQAKGWFLRVCVDLPDPRSWRPATPVGVDRGVGYIAVARALGASPRLCSAGMIQHVRRQYSKTRERLQGKATPSARRVLRHLSGRESRFVVDANRKAARGIVDYALQFDRPVLVLENLKGVQDRCLGRDGHGAAHRSSISTWTYNSFLACLELAAEDRGLPIDFVTPAWSSRTCPRCGDAREANRRGTRYHCLHCGYRNHADVVGATNLARRWLHEHALPPWGSVNGPDERGNTDWTDGTESLPDVQAAAQRGGVDTPLPTRT